MNEKISQFCRSVSLSRATRLRTLSLYGHLGEPRRRQGGLRGNPSKQKGGEEGEEQLRLSII